MIGRADLPVRELGTPPRRGPTPRSHDDHPAIRRAQPIRAVSAPRIRQASASAAAAAAVLARPAARNHGWLELPAPHRLSREAPWPTIREPADLRRLVSRRDARDPIAVAVSWAHELGSSVRGTTGAELIAWGKLTHRLESASATTSPGDLLIFDRAVSDAPADLVAIVIARDGRGVTELIFVGGGVVRRGFVDVRRKSVRRDRDGKVVNTFMRTGKRWPPRGTRYLAGELLAHVIRR